MRPLLVVEHEGLVGRRAQEEGAPRDRDVTGPGTSAVGPAARGQGRRRVAQRLSRVEERLVVHVLVEDGVGDEVEQGFARSVRQAPQHPLAHLGHVGFGLREGGQRQGPPRIVRDGPERLARGDQCEYAARAQDGQRAVDVGGLDRAIRPEFEHDQLGERSGGGAGL